MIVVENKQIRNTEKVYLRSTGVCKLSIMWCKFVYVLLCICLCAATTEINFQVEENLPTGTLVGTVDAGEGPPYSLFGSEETRDKYVSLNEGTGEIRTTTVLDHETTAVIKLLIATNSESFSINIKVIDKNDNSPEFSVPRITVDIPESAPISTKKVLGSAIDKDVGDFTTIGYNITSGNDENMFELSVTRRLNVLYVDLVLMDKLDYELEQHYVLEILAYDGGVPPRTAILTVDINVLDDNDNTPIFNQSRYSTSIPEDTALGSSVVQVCRR